ncbi:MAG: response regulator [Candidatus Aminicenantales bacterium]|jgi:CheY-like chemotaxis protein
MKPTAFPPARILIVEDETIVAMEIQDLLEAEGWTVTGVSTSGEDAVGKARDTRPDLVLMDITLRGGMTGIEAAERILDAGVIPVLFLTAAADQSGILRIRERTDCGFVSKPFEERAFIIEIRRLLQAARR